MNQRNSKIRWLVFVGVVLLIVAIVFCIWLPIKNKTKAPSSNQNTNIETENNINTNDNDLDDSLKPKDNAEKKDFQNKVADKAAEIENDPNNVQNYIDKSQYEYLLGDNQAALQTVKEGLKIDPNNDLLQNRRDVLLNNNISNSNEDAPRQ